jgi:hypothetical protein
MDFAYVTVEATLVTKTFPIAGTVVAMVWTTMFVLVSPAVFEYGHSHGMRKIDLLQRRLRRKQLLFGTSNHAAPKRYCFIRSDWLNSLGNFLRLVDKIDHVDTRPEIIRCLYSRVHG